MIQETFFIDDGDAHLYSVLFMPETGFSNKAVLFCHPLFEEKKASHRVLVELARSLAGKGFASLMFDLRACGDSRGDVLDFSPSVWLDDVRSSIAWLKKRYENPGISLLGIRFGAALAVQAAVKVQGIEDLILIDPVVRGRDYLNEVFQQKCVREMMTFGEARSDVPAMFAELGKTGMLDVDGTIISSSFTNAVKEIDISKEDFSTLKRILLIQQSPRKSLLPAYEALQTKCRDGNISMDISMLTAPPFWKAVDMADSEAICRTILPWCR